MTNTAKGKLFQAALAADDAWQAELVRLFGKDAGDVRYTKAGEGEFGSKLNTLYLAYKFATESYRDSLRETA